MILMQVYQFTELSQYELWHLIFTTAFSASWESLLSNVPLLREQLEYRSHGYIES